VSLGTNTVVAVAAGRLVVDVDGVAFLELLPHAAATTSSPTTAIRRGRPDPGARTVDAYPISS
jgi:hypothetical protein